MIASVLVVEDDVPCRDAMRGLLEDEGYRVLCAADGVEALATMRCEAIGVVLLDARMPRMDGLEFRRRQREDAALRDVPVVLVTADRGVAIDDAVAIVLKPYDADELLNAVAKHVRARGPKRRSSGGPA